MGFEVSKEKNDWTVCLVCDVCSEDITIDSLLYWSWSKSDEKSYTSAVPLLVHQSCSNKVFRKGDEDSEFLNMRLTDYLSILHLKFPIGPAFLRTYPTQESDS